MDYNIPPISKIYKFRIPPMDRNLFLCVEHRGVYIQCGDKVFSDYTSDFSYWPIEVVGEVEVETRGIVNNIYFSYSDTKPRQFY